jgi:hypothetical protein
MKGGYLQRGGMIPTQIPEVPKKKAPDVCTTIFEMVPEALSADANTVPRNKM